MLADTYALALDRRKAERAAAKLEEKVARDLDAMKAAAALIRAMDRIYKERLDGKRAS